MFVGDLVAKRDVDDSLETLSLIQQLENVSSVRGNHDQKVIEVCLVTAISIVL